MALVLFSGSESGPEREIAGLNYSAEEFERIKLIAGDSAKELANSLESAIEAKLKADSMPQSSRLLQKNFKALPASRQLEVTAKMNLLMQQAEDATRAARSFIETIERPALVKGGSR